MSQSADSSPGSRISRFSDVLGTRLSWILVLLLRKKLVSLYSHWKSPMISRELSPVRGMHGIISGNFKLQLSSPAKLSSTSQNICLDRLDCLRFPDVYDDSDFR